jgi:hypothetical protein
MELTRKPIANRVLGESLATLSDEDNSIELPISASNFQEVKQSQEIAREYRFTVALENEFFHMNPFFNVNRFSSGKAFIREQIGIANNWIGKSGALMSAYAPKFSSSIMEKSKEIDLTARISIGSNSSFACITEAPSVYGTRRLIAKYQRVMKDEGIEKEILLILNMGRDEDEYAKKYALAESLGIRNVMSEWENPTQRWRNFLTTANYHNSGILRIISGIPKSYLGKSAMLPLGILLGDVVAHAPILGGGGDDHPKQQKRLTPAQRKRIAITNATRFHIPDNGLYTQAGFKQDHITKHGCGCEADDFAGETVEDFYREFNNNLYDATGLHNTKSIYEAIRRSRAFIGKGLGEAMNAKKRARNVLEGLYHINLNQTTLLQTV